MDYPKSDATVGLVGGKFTDGDPGAGVAASRDPSSWANLVTDELLNVLVAGGIVPDEATNTQVRDAIQAIITGRFTGSAQLLSAPGYQKFPGGLILQWGKGNGTTGGPATIMFPTTFPNAIHAMTTSTQNTAAYAAVLTVAPGVSNFEVDCWTIQGSPTRSVAAFYYFAIGH